MMGQRQLLDTIVEVRNAHNGSKTKHENCCVDCYVVNNICERSMAVLKIVLLGCLSRKHDSYFDKD